MNFPLYLYSWCPVYPCQSGYILNIHISTNEIPSSTALLLSSITSIVNHLFLLTQISNQSIAARRILVSASEARGPAPAPAHGMSPIPLHQAPESPSTICAVPGVLGPPPPRDFVPRKIPIQTLGLHMSGLALHLVQNRPRQHYARSFGRHPCSKIPCSKPLHLHPPK